MKTIYLAGGCFWGVGEYFSRILGVLQVTVGYANGHTKTPTYEEVCRKNTGHAETVELRYDPNRVSLETLICQYFKYGGSRAGFHFRHAAGGAKKTPGPHCGGMPPAGKVLSRRGIPPGVPEKESRRLLPHQLRIPEGSWSRKASLPEAHAGGDSASPDLGAV